MKLFYSPTSPFVRKVLVLAHETGLSEQIEKVVTVNTAIAQDKTLVANNPLGKIPALIGDDGHVHYDSRVICQYLDSLHQGDRLYPEHTSQKWDVLRLEALCDGITDAAVIARYEQALRPSELYWADWFDGQMNKVKAGINALERDLPILENSLTIAAIAAGCTLDYIDFRHPSLNWRENHPHLADWTKVFNQRASMQATQIP